MSKICFTLKVLHRTQSQGSVPERPGLTSRLQLAGPTMLEYAAISLLLLAGLVIALFIGLCSRLLSSIGHLKPQAS
jgi:hypothetical protein